MQLMGEDTKLINMKWIGKNKSYRFSRNRTANMNNNFIFAIPNNRFKFIIRRNIE